MSNAKTLSQSQISDEIRKQRERELNVVLGRFNRPIEVSSSNDLNSKSVKAPPPPPPAPPMPSWGKERSADGKSQIKRKSNGSWLNFK